MTRLIDADIFVKQLEDYIEHAENFEFQMAVIGVVNDLKKQPTVDAEPVRHGKWDYVTVVDEGFWKCSSCGTPSEAIGAKKLYKYCPFCGAKMRDEDGH